MVRTKAEFLEQVRFHPCCDRLMFPQDFWELSCCTWCSFQRRGGACIMTFSSLEVILHHDAGPSAPLHWWEIFWSLRTVLACAGTSPPQIIYLGDLCLELPPEHNWAHEAAPKHSIVVLHSLQSNHQICRGHHLVPISSPLSFESRPVDIPHTPLKCLWANLLVTLD